MDGFVERDCVIRHEGKTFESGGAWLCPCSDGRLRGVVYAKPESGVVTDWHGKTLAPACYGAQYQGVFCRMRSVSFVWEGRRFHGRYCPDWAQTVRVRSNKVA